MIRSLKRKFICITMALAALVLAVVCGFLLVRTWQEQDTKVSAALTRVASYVSLQQGGTLPADGADADDAADAADGTPADGAGYGAGLGRGLRGGRDGADTLSSLSVATFWAAADSTGTVTSSGAEGITVDADTLQTLVTRVLAAGKTAGTLTDAEVSYSVQTIGGSTCVLFADRTASMATVRSLALNLLLVSAAALAAFYAVSRFLASWALRPVQKAWEEQRRFIADASHELKTPLTVILANTDILAAHPAETVGSQQKWIDGTREEGARMKKLIDDLLFLARSDAAQAAQTAPVFARVDLSDLTQGALLSFESVAFEAGVDVAQEIAPGLAVTGSEDSLRRLLTILLDNACKYAAGPRRVRVTLRAEKETALLTVSNTGTPVAPEALPHLFERFYRPEQSRVHGAAGGYGLGLAIAKTIAESMRGTIAAESDAQSTRFLVRLPLAKN